MKKLIKTVERLLDLRDRGHIVSPEGVELLNELEADLAQERETGQANLTWSKRQVVGWALMKAAAEERVTVRDVVSNSRAKVPSRSRHCFFYYLASKAVSGEFNRSLSRLAEITGYDRTTIAHGAAKYAELRGWENPTGYQLSAKRAANERHQMKEKQSS